MFENGLLRLRIARGFCLLNARWKIYDCASCGGPVGFDFYCTYIAGLIVVIAGPGPIFRTGNEAALFGIAVHVAEFLDALVFGVNVEVVVAG